jgi:hypothetical protein
MLCGNLKKILSDCNDSSEIIVFVKTEDGQYRPFKNITIETFNKGSTMEQIHFDVSVHKEFKSIHFPKNLDKETVDDLKEKRDMLLEELKEIENELGEY